jgi:hypothetical protein
MTEPLERDDVIGLLAKLGSDRDEEVLEAARQVNALVTAAGVTWEELLVSEDAHEESDESVAEEDQDEAAEIVELPADEAKKNSETLALIDKLLARSGISEDFREELTAYKTDIAEGEFQEADHRYIRAVYKRLSKRR